jgi:hypothetical protein
MGCCGQKRTNLRNNLAPAATPGHAQPVLNRQLLSPAQPVATAVTLRYLQSSPLRVQGPVTGRHYEFSAARPVQTVDPRDAEALVRTRCFRRA